MFSETIVQLLIIGLALTEVELALHIYRHKKRNQPLICPFNANCEAVIHSRFSNLFGIPVELLGAVYYALFALAYGLIFVFGTPSIILLRILHSSITIAFAFSFYLTSIQLFFIKQFCSWCLISAGLSALIFMLNFFV